MAQRVPINGEAGIGYVLESGFDLPPLMLTADEIEAVSLGPNGSWPTLTQDSPALHAMYWPKSGLSGPTGFGRLWKNR